MANQRSIKEMKEHFDEQFRLGGSKDYAKGYQQALKDLKGRRGLK